MSNYAAIKPIDIANGIGVRVSVFVSGCSHHCPGCFNEVAWDYQYGQPVTDDTFHMVEQFLAKPFVNGITMLGGEPLDEKNAECTYEFVRRAKAMGKGVWIYSGYTFEQIIRMPYCEDILHYCDVLVDGPFIQSLADKRLLFRGSSNQRIIDIPKTMQLGTIVLWDETQSR